jgi:hypothetical protein
MAPFMLPTRVAWTKGVDGPSAAHFQTPKFTTPYPLGPASHEVTDDWTG